MLKIGKYPKSSNFRGQLKNINVVPTISNMCNISYNSAVDLSHFHMQKKILTAFSVMSGDPSYFCRILF
jgi:hypothetical protein